jgi:inorganic triphosphatase YgiF
LELEAKFRIPDERTFQLLLEAKSLAGFDLGEPRRIQLHDWYLDTPDGALRAAGYAFRLRQQGAGYTATLKGFGTVSGAIHRRIEHEVRLTEAQQPQDWPHSTARDLALRLIGSKSLQRLFEIKQTRYCRDLCDGARAVAELSLDRVHMLQGTSIVATCLELEAELLIRQGDHYLRQLSTNVQAAWGLDPEPKSKFERGMALFGFELETAQAQPPSAAVYQIRHGN